MAAYRHKAEATVSERTVLIPSGESVIGADLTIPEGARGIVVVAHGSGSNRTSRRNRWVASELNWGRLATLLVDLLTIEEAALDQDTGEYRFDIQFLSHRLIDAIDWVSREPEIRHLPVGVFGASTGAAPFKKSMAPSTQPLSQECSSVSVPASSVCSMPWAASN